MFMVEDFKDYFCLVMSLPGWLFLLLNFDKVASFLIYSKNKSKFLSYFFIVEFEKSLCFRHNP